MDTESKTADGWLSREEALLGGEAVAKLCRSSVMLFGCGGVGGYIAEALVRAGIGKLIAVDHDVVSESNLNRQIVALRDTVGKPKVKLIAERAMNINADINVYPLQIFITPDNAAQLIDEAAPDYICDAVDNVTAKIAIIEAAKERGIPVISSMGTGNKLDPSRFRITDIAKSEVCPLARVMRRELGKRGIKNVDALWSDEPPVKTNMRTPASVSFVPACAGLMIAGHVILRLANG